MKEIECRKGFTILELMIVIAILGIFAALFIPRFLSSADGMELQKIFPADDASIQEAARAMRADIEQIIVILVYDATWEADKSDSVMDELEKIQAKFIKLGIPGARVTLLLANKGGFERDGATAPVKDGVYLYLE